MARGRRLKSYLDYENALGDGIGVGYGQSYQPWLRAQDVKSRGNRSIVFGLKTFRNHHLLSSVESNFFGTVAKLAMRQPFVLFKGLTFQKLCLPGAFRPGDHHNKMLRPGLCVVHASPQYL